MEESIRQWIESNIAAGYSVDQLRQSLQENGYDPHLMDEYLGSYSQQPTYNVPQTKDVMNLYVFIFSICTAFIMILSPFLSWINYSAFADTGTISGIATPFGKAMIFVGASSLILSLSSKFLNRKFSMGIIALGIFAIGVVAISMYFQVDIVSNLKSIAQVSGSGIKTSSVETSNALGSYIALLSGIMCCVAGTLPYFKQKKA